MVVEQDEKGYGVPGDVKAKPLAEISGCFDVVSQANPDGNVERYPVL